jgi:DNA-binding YbaB/EbfC family protein
MNMQAIMQQAQKMQRDLQKKKDELNKKEFTGTSELVEVVFTGDKKLKSVNIKIEGTLDQDDKEVLEDMMVIAINDAMGKIDKETESMLGAYSSLGGLF